MIDHDTEPATRLDERFSSPGATATPWAAAIDLLCAAQVFWLTTVRTDGRPHVTPLLTVWADGALWFCTGVDEQKRRNLVDNDRVALTTGTHRFEGMDVVVEGRAVREHDDERLRRLADEWLRRHGPAWRFTVGDGAFHNEVGGEAHVFRVDPLVAHGYGKGETFSQTRWRFD